MNPCDDCGALPGERHAAGCDIEPCALCGGQRISCGCVYEVNGMRVSELERKHPKIFENGPTPEMEEKYWSAVEAVGGPIPWTGLWPGVAECREFGWYARRNPNGPGYVPCDPREPGAIPDLNRLLREARWDPHRRRFVRPEK